MAMNRMYAKPIDSTLVGKMVTDGKREALIVQGFEGGAGQQHAIVFEDGEMAMIHFSSECPWNIKE